VKKIKTDGKKPKIWSVSNFDLTYSHMETVSHNPLIESDELKRTRGAIGYSYAPQARPFEPFRKLIKSKSKWLTLIKDVNFNYAPSQISIKADVFRQFGATRPRNVGGGPYKIAETYNKYFTFDRYYILQWNPTRSLAVDFSATNNARIDEPFGRINTQEKKDSVRKNFFKGGRNTNYQQELTLNYTVPTNKLPLLDWTSLRVGYNTKYNWLAASLLAKELGNKLSNTQTRNINGELKFEDLYSKSRLLRAVSMQSANFNQTPRESGRSKSSSKGQGADAGKTGGKDATGVTAEKAPTKSNADKRKEAIESITERLVADAKNNPSLADPRANYISPKGVAYKIDTIKNKEGKVVKIKKKRLKKIKAPKESMPMPELSGAAKAVLSLATSVKRVGIQYTEDFGTTLPGYMDSTILMGSNFNSHQPGLKYLFGYQPDTNWINGMGAKGLLSRDSLVSDMIQQRYNQQLKLTAQVSPFRDLTIDLNLDKTFDKSYSELYKDTTGSAGLTRLNPYALGSFSISYISYQTLFTSFDPKVVSSTFKQFEENRKILSRKLAGLNPYQSGTVDPDGYSKGYGRYAQDVVLPAFISAYTNKDPLQQKLIKNSNPSLRANPFNGLIPKPNWTITYNGLTNLPGFDQVFSRFSLRHGYKSTLNMNSFNTALLFTDPLRVGYPKFRDTLTGNFVPYFLVPNITIQEAFEPLIEVDMTFTNQLEARFEYKKSRTLSLSLIDYQLAENRSTEVAFSMNWRKKGVPLIKKIPFGKNGTKLDNDVTLKMDFSLRDDATANSKLDQGTAFGTGGQKVIRISPSIDYVVNNKVNVKLYFEQNRNIPKISSSFPITNTKGGVQVTISLAQ
jgi:cell surface protein SprA